MELSFRLVLAIVIGIIILLAVVMIFWSTIAKFLGITEGNTLALTSWTQTLVKSQCSIFCTMNKESIRAGAAWQIAFDLNSDGPQETINCKDGSVTAWGNNNQPSKCKGIGCEATCGCVQNAWSQAPMACS